MKAYIKEQIEWFKDFFDEVQPNGSHKPSIKSLIMLLLTITFMIAYLKKIVIASELLDIPQEWALVFIGILGITSVLTGARAYFNRSGGNANLNGGNDNGNSDDKKDNGGQK